MSNDPALDAHEHAEHAEHAAHARDPFISRVTITVAVLAVMAAAAGSMETVEGGLAITASSEAVLSQDKATDTWNEYQADSLKKHMYGIAADQGGPHEAEFRKTAKKIPFPGIHAAVHGAVSATRDFDPNAVQLLDVVGRGCERSDERFVGARGVVEPAAQFALLPARE